MVFLGDRYSHAVSKEALLAADAGVADRLWEREVITATGPPAGHLEAAKTAMAAVHDRVGETSYARVDVIDGNDGIPVVLEVELVEPSLFLHTAEGSARRFVDVLADLLA